VSGSYLTYYLGHPSVRAWILANSSGSVIRSMNKETLSSLPVVYPPTREQDEIVEILYALDRKIAIHAEICTTTSRLRDSLLPLLMSNENISGRLSGDTLN
jgi:type I restriction enzyme, S subunit